MEYITPKEAQKILKVHPMTLYKYADKGIIDMIRTPGGKRLYNIKGYIDKLNKENNVIDEQKKDEKINICYCRVSTNSQKDDLKRQIDYMKNKYPSYEIIKDIGSGINFKRKGLKKLIDLAVNNKLNKVIIAFKDRLCRIGFELIEHLIKEYSNGEIIIENDISLSPEEEVVKDLLQILTVFSARINGLRSYKKLIKENLSTS